ncbi:metal ABC transporter ATP-binding protein [Desulfosporosinus hippei]|uniref:Zinc transport system ATP-binding protein n=1 Tax=Desulfosporosinus hippei DSM 8344 TaxID=1121419 RepID=A0A1G7T1X5_9FIRM|nr:metal ABC transporter ATP-binding protein [Desulfosporosinus hippei]SDG29251.1 zinc transport system ATP-binding protein [Desulfosporosinus hippei DSM 8344]
MKHPICVNSDCKICESSLCCTKINNFGVKRSGIEILKNVNLHIHCGDLTAVIGPNGAGKSTLLKAILGEISHTGELQFLDANNGTTKPSMGYVPQKLDLDSTSPTSVLDLFAAAYTNLPIWFTYPKKIRERVRESLALTHGEHLINKRLGELSGGELQRVLLALALDPVPHLLLLDEPVSGIDQKGLELFYQTVSTLRKNYDLSIILVSHDLNLVAEYANRVAFVNNRTIECCGTPQEVFTNEKVIQTFGLDWSNRFQRVEKDRVANALLV